MRSMWRYAVVAGIVLGCAGGAMAEGSQTLQGEVVDPALYLREGRHGPEVEDMIYDAVDGGQTLALLDDAGSLYLFLAGEAGADPNELLYEHVGRKIKISGTVYERGGLKGIVVTSVESLESAEAQAIEPPAPATP